jgi:hypothetical protein
VKDLVMKGWSARDLGRPTASDALKVFVDHSERTKSVKRQISAQLLS